MPLLYVDESFNKREFWLSGLVVPERRACELEGALDNIVQKAALSFAVDPRAELHGHDLAQGKGDWASMQPKLRARLGVYREALDAIRAIPEVHAFQYGLDRDRLRAKYANPWPEREILIGYLAQRAHNAMSASDHLIIVVDDAPAQNSMREHVRTLKARGTHSKYNPSPLRRIVDTLYFAPSDQSRLLQASDLVSHMHFRARHPGSNTKATQAAQDMWAIVSPRCQSNMWAIS